jgi:Ca2+-binding EF-hand superfamily protein
VDTHRNCEEEATKYMEEMHLDKDGRVSYAEFVIKWRIS